MKNIHITKAVFPVNQRLQIGAAACDSERRQQQQHTHCAERTQRQRAAGGGRGGGADGGAGRLCGDAQRSGCAPVTHS